LTPAIAALMAVSDPATSPATLLSGSISFEIVSVACLAWLARFLTSDATTANPRLAGAGGFDRGVQRQQVDLSGDVADQLDDAAHRLRRPNFERCWKNSDGIERHELERIFVDGDKVTRIDVYFGATYHNGKFVKQP
jgi:hypothetical protein